MSIPKVKHEIRIFVIVAAMAINVTNFYHKIYQIRYRKHFIVLNRILGVYCINERPIFINNINIVSVYPVITTKQ